MDEFRFSDFQARAGWSRPVARRLLVWAVPLMLTLGSSQAFAVLGGNLASINTDMAAMGASGGGGAIAKTTTTTTTMNAASASPDVAGGASSPAAAPFSVHEINTAAGTVVREYTNASGQVFGIAWQGPTIPDLRQLLGDYFTPYTQQLSAERAAHPARGPARVDTDTLVVHSGGHMRAFSGQAYLPQLLPPGVTADQIQ
jgi:hypothetical protein